MPFDKVKFVKISLIGAGIAMGLGILIMLGGWLLVSRQLPSVDLLKDVQLQQALRVYSYDGKLIAEYGEKRRIPLPIAEVPQAVKDAFLAAEDDRFYEHPGVDYQGLARAVINQLLTGDRSQGGSTITMQVARNFFLGSEKSYRRKISEILLALRIEKELSKDEILELYLNKIYLGKRAYGIAAASQVYYGKQINELTLPQVAMIAGLPKAPSRYNPVVNPERATLRRNYVLRRMLELKMIEQPAYDAAILEPVTTAMYEMPAELEAPYVGEMVRAQLVERFGEDIYTSGLRIYTTVDSRLQQAANQALRNGLLDYDQRHGYRGPIRQLQLPAGMTEIALIEVDEAALAAEAAATEAAAEAEVEADEENEDNSSRQGLIERSSSPAEPAQAPKSSWSFRDIDRELETIGHAGNIRPALVTRLLTLPEPPAKTDKEKVPPENLQAAEIYLGARQYGQMGFEQVKWAKPFISTDAQGPEPKAITDVIKVGDYVWVLQRDEKWSLVQLPQVEGALASLDPQSGAVLALTGGFDFYRSKFNRAVQARRQPGSSFKPFIFAAALDKGYTAASIINDAPVVFDDPALEGKWRPENYSGEFFGPTRLREGLVKSRNLVSIRLLQDMGIERARRFVQKFGFSEESLPRDLSLALGSGTVTPLEMTRGFGAFANDGYLVTPYFIDRIENGDGKLLWLADYRVACVKCFIEKIDPVLLMDGYEVELPPDGTAPAGEATEAANVATPAPAVISEPATDGMEIIAEVVAKSREPGIGVNMPEESPVQAEAPAPTSDEPASATAVEPESEPVLKRRVKPLSKILEPEVAYIMNSMLRDVILRGTGVRARVLGRNDLAGKTGTTNDEYDAWFSGFNQRYVTTTWIGFDGFRPLGAQEAGAAASLPVWIDYMKVALEGVPEQLSSQPDGIVSMRIDAETGLLAGNNTREAIFEIFRLDTAPTEESTGVAGVDPFGGASGEALPDDGSAPAASDLF